MSTREIPWAERVALATPVYQGIENAAEWQHYIDRPWYSLIRIHDRLWNDRENWGFELRYVMCGVLLGVAYEICLEQWKTRKALK